MDNSFFAYLERLEQMAFFSGYPLLYAVVLFIAGKNQLRDNFKSRAVSLLPFAYALVGTLYLGLLLKNLYPDYTFGNIKRTMQQPWLIIWGLLSILFWIPALCKKRVLSILHSLVFFYFLVRDLFVHSFQTSGDNNVIRNDMKIYTDSLLLNLGAFVIIVFLSILLTHNKRHTGT